MANRAVKAAQEVPGDARSQSAGVSSDDRLTRYARWNETVAALGQIALVATELQELMDHSVRRLAATLKIEFVEILELDSEGKTLSLRTGHGWRTDSSPRKKIPATANSQPGFTLIAKEPVVLADLGSETRFANPAYLEEHGVVSGMTVAIGGNPRAYGVLGIYSTTPRFRRR